MSRLAAVAAAFLLSVSLAEAQGRTLYWQSMAVDARLEASGALLVTERHHMVFDGAWNGGERPFRVGAARPELISVTRIDPTTGARRPLSAATGSAMGMDEYGWAGANLRWRSRRASDPPFRNQAIVYVVEYRLHGIVVPDGERYRINHDFAFTGRPGAIQRFTLALAFDPSWEAAPGVTLPLERTDVGPEQTVTLLIPLKWTGAGRPSDVAAAPVAAPLPVAAPVRPPGPVASPADKTAALVLFLVLAGLITFWFVRRENESGAFVRPPEITPQWLEDNIFRHRAEVIGAAWDGKTGQAEVAALISILIAEGKIANLPGKSPKLKLLVPRKGLVDYERAFVDRLFIDGDEIDPARLKRHYAASGFDPAESIRGPLETAARDIVGANDTKNGRFGCLAMMLTMIAMPVAGVSLDLPDWAYAFLFGAVLYPVSAGLAALYRSRFQNRMLAVLIAAPLALMGAMLALMVTNVTALEGFLVLTLVLVFLAFLSARSARTPRDYENFRALLAARRFFKEHLKVKGARVEERWVPYLLGFGLGKELDRWSVAAPRAETTRDDAHWSSSTSTTTSRSAAAPDASFQPGGGAYGGGGASGSWASSIGSFAAVVAAPASESSGSSSSDWSSSSSSSSSGSSGSGGGSGGGW